MRIRALVLVLVLSPFTVCADEGTPLPTAVDATVQAAALAHKAGQTAAFHALVARDEPDPWLVAEGLWVAGTHEAAAAVVAARPRPATEGLTAYLENRAAAEAADTVTAIARDHATAQAKFTAGDFKAALPGLTALAGRTRRCGWHRRLASLLYLKGIAHQRLREGPLAIAPWKERLAILLALGRYHQLGDTLNNLYLVLLPMGRMQEGEALHARTLAALPATNAALPRIQMLQALARLFMNGGQPARALAPCTEALALAQGLGRRDILFDQVLALGQVHQETTSYAKARTRFEEAYAIARTLDDTARMARVQTQLGYVALGVTNAERARTHLTKALALYRTLGAKGEIGRALINASLVVDAKTALAYLKEAVRLLKDVGDDRNLSRALMSIPVALDKLGRAREARPYLERALELAERMRDIPSIFGIHLSLAYMARIEGTPEKALPHLKAAARVVEKHGSWGQRLLVLGARVDHERLAGRPAEAVRRALQAVAWVQEAARGHADRDAATVRTRFARVFSAGALSAHTTGDHEALFTLLESGRALMLRESLAAGDDRAALLTPALKQAEAAARTDELRARSDYTRAAKRDDRRKRRAAKRRLEAAQAAYDAVIDSIRQKQRAAAGLLYPRIGSVAAVRQALPRGSALLILGSSVEPLPCVALLVRRDSVRSFELPPAKDLQAAVRAIQLDTARNLKLSALAALARTIIAPLGLNGKDQRLLVSPTGALAAVPWALLVPERQVAFIPSASVWLEQRRDPPTQATEVLGLGDPDYGRHPHAESQRSFRERGGALRALPFTRPEVNAVASVRLLGAQATEGRLADLLRSRDSWRAIHFACHGLIDGDDIMRSALALTADPKDDGFLTVREIYRLPFRTQLVTLSACESGRGEAIWGEGTLGLAQAFMVSGASSVLCSLWKVDDEATRTLMVKFYELWNPPASADAKTRPDAVAALRAAQAFVRTHPDHPKWKHPYYWAAWVLWGLPD